jgi:hypothetical protein
MPYSQSQINKWERDRRAKAATRRITLTLFNMLPERAQQDILEREKLIESLKQQINNAIHDNNVQLEEEFSNLIKI